MKQEDKELLLKDLCSRLPYGVKCILSEYHIEEFPYNGTYCDKVLNLGINGSTINLLNHIEKYGVKPYLRPMSSMTEEEKREIYNWLVENDVDWFDFSKLRLDEILISFDSSWLLVNWLNAHHFDYRGLIEKGLAIEVTEDNNPYEQNKS